jgi:crotonobetainyl-CoA:carnitine CoA-transferase CaiB-like acyl-CoA transferase
LSALSSYKVLELANGVAGEYCGKLLADFGAEVIKIEPPGRGSNTRHCGPFAGGKPGVERSGLFAYLNTNKRSVALDVTSDVGRATLTKLLERVDAVIDDHAVGWLASIGLDPATVAQRWPRLILCSITPYGQNPPEDRLHAEDLNVFHMSGWGYHTPTAPDESLPPLKGAGRFLASYEGGLEAALCISAALYEREQSGKGEFIDVSKQEVLASRVDYVLGPMIAGDVDVTPTRTAFDLGGPAGIFRCRDGFAYIWLSAPSHWEGLRKLLGNPEWMNDLPPHWLERECTPERVALTRKHLAEWLITQNKEDASAAAQKLGVTLVAVNNAGDLLASPQYQFREFFVELRHPEIGSAKYPTVPYRMSATPVRITRAAPRLGEHTADYVEGTAGGRS